MEDACPEESGRLASEIWNSEVLPGNLELRVLRLAFHAGQQAAVYCGLEASRGEWAVTMDDDLQHHPSFLPRLLEWRAEPVDLVYALPAGPRGAGSRGRDRLFRHMLNLPAGIALGSFRLIRGSALERIRGKGRGFVYVSALLLRMNPDLRIRNILYPVLPPASAQGGCKEDGALREEGGSEEAGMTGTTEAGPSRIPLTSRLTLTLKLILKYGVLRGRSLPWSGDAYRTGEEL